MVICLVVIPSYITEQVMRKLALWYANNFSKQKTVGKMSDHELLSPDNSGYDWDNVILAEKNNNRGGGVAIRMSWYAFFEKINSRGDVCSAMERNASLLFT